MKKYFIFFILFIFLACQKNKIIPKKLRQTFLYENVCEDTSVHYFLGIDVQNLIVDEKSFQKNQTIQNLLKEFNIDKKKYTYFFDITKEEKDLNTLKPNDKYFAFYTTDSIKQLKYIAFKTSLYEYLIVNMQDSFKINIFEKKVDTLDFYYTGIIQKTLQKNLKDTNIDLKIIPQIEVALKGKITPQQLQKNDSISFIYTMTTVNGELLETNDIKAIYIKTKKKIFWSLDYFIEEDSSYQFIDENGKYLKTAFLKSPIQNGGNIVSRYNLHRFHPILQVEKAHLGTDFAAPHGTPIIATASGFVEAATFTANNGNYVKIRHDKTYETQYLHMSKIAKGMRNGVRVKQGQVIGFVGSTGLATGPHVCYRFWKFGTQVDPLKEKLNVIQEIPANEKQKFEKYFNEIKNILLNNFSKL